MRTRRPEEHGPPRRRRIPIELVGLLIILLLGAAGWFGVWFYRGYTEPYMILIEPAEGVRVDPGGEDLEIRHGVSPVNKTIITFRRDGPPFPISELTEVSELAETAHEKLNFFVAFVPRSRFGRRLGELRLFFDWTLDTPLRPRYPNLRLSYSGAPVDGLWLLKVIVDSHDHRHPGRHPHRLHCFIESDLPCRVAARNGRPREGLAGKWTISFGSDAEDRLAPLEASPPPGEEEP